MVFNSFSEGQFRKINHVKFSSNNVKKYLQDPVYYIFLLFDRIKKSLHNHLEPRIKINNSQGLEDFQIFLWKKLFSNLIIDKDGWFYKTNVTNKNSPMLLSQARTILILCNNYEKGEPKFKSNHLIKALTKSLISMREKNGLFKFNKPSWDLQDEGIASEWATLALIKSYETTSEKEYLEAAILTMEAMIKYLYSKETSLVHTEGDNFWCLDSASTFAYVCSLLLKHAYSKKVEEVMIDSINLCINNIADDGHFPYHAKRQGIYLLLYHPIVMITLEYCLRSEYLDDVITKRLIDTLVKAKSFLLNSISKEKKIFEPTIKQLSQFVISNVTSLVALKNKIEPDFEKILLNNVVRFWNNDTLYLCRDQKERLYNGDLYNISDSYLIEVMYWFDLYLN